MNKSSKIYIAGHTGLVGSAMMRRLQSEGYTNIITRTSKELDLRRQEDTEKFFDKERPEYVFLAAAKVGGILANSTYKAEFIYDNISIAANVVHSAYQYGVRKLLNLGSSCIYPRLAPQPMREDYLLSGTLEPTNEPYAVAKIAAMKLCRYYNEQYGTHFISAMPTNLYGPHDNYDLETSHVLPALIRKFHLAKFLCEGKFDEIIKDLLTFGNSPNFLLHPSNSKGDMNSERPPVSTKMDRNSIIEHLSRFGIKIKPSTLTLSSTGKGSSSTFSGMVTLWGSGEPYREFLFIDDLADATIFLMKNYDYKDIGEFINIGTGEEITIRELTDLVTEVIGYKGEIQWDPSKPDGMPRKLLDSSRLHHLGWNPKTSLKEGIYRTYQSYCFPLAQ